MVRGAGSPDIGTRGRRRTCRLDEAVREPLIRLMSRPSALSHVSVDLMDSTAEVEGSSVG